MTDIANALHRKLDEISNALIEFRAMIADLELPDQPKRRLTQCPNCGPIGLPKGVTLKDHQHNVHGHDRERPQ